LTAITVDGKAIAEQVGVEPTRTEQEVSRSRNTWLPATPSTDPDARLSRIRLLP